MKRTRVFNVAGYTYIALREQATCVYNNETLKYIDIPDYAVNCHYLFGMAYNIEYNGEYSRSSTVIPYKDLKTYRLRR